MDHESILAKFRDEVRADLEKGGVRPLPSYLAELGGDLSAKLAREYERIVADEEEVHATGWEPVASTISAPSNDGRGRRPKPRSKGRGASPLPPARPPSSLESALEALTPLPDTLVRGDEIARGGMGAIVRVRDESLRRDLAMKAVLGEGETSRALLERFIDEAHIQAQLDHPGVVPIHQLGLDDQGRVSFTMKLVKGRSLESIVEEIHRGGVRPSLTRAVQVLLRVAETMSYAHEKGVIHRDLKPANVMVGRFGEVYVMDWGLAKVIAAPEKTSAPAKSVVWSRATPDGGVPVKLTNAGTILGTAPYMPPEQAAGLNSELDARSDVYALGATLYEVICGRSPYHDRQFAGIGEAVMAVMAGPPKPLGEIVRGHDELVAVVEKAMSRDRALRYASAGEMAADLQRWIEGRLVRAHRTGAWAEMRNWVHRNRAIAATLAVTALVVGSISVRYALLEIDAREAIARQRDVAVAAGEEARREARRADGLRLATVATTLADKDPTASALLALEGAELAPGPVSLTALYAAVGGVSELHTLSGHESYVTHGRWSPDGSRVYTAGIEGRLVSWDATSGAELRRTDAHAGALTALEVIGRGERIVSAGLDGAVRAWDAATLERAWEARPGGKFVYAAAPSPDGGRVAIAGSDGVARVLDAATGQELARFDGHAAPVASVAWSPDGRQIASAGADFHVRVWDARTGVASIALRCFDASAEPPRIAVDGGLPDRTPSVAWSADGARIVTAGRSFAQDVGHGVRAVRVWDAVSGTQVAPRSDATWTELVTLSSESRRAIVAAPSVADPARVVSVDLETGEASDVVWNATQRSRDRARFSPDGRVLAFAEPGFRVGLWSASSGVRLKTLTGHRYSVTDLSFSPDGRRLLTTSNDRTARIWDAEPSHVRRGIALRSSPSREASVHYLAAGASLVVVEWKDPATDRIERELVDGSAGATVYAPTPATAHCFPSPDGRRVAVMTEHTLEVREIASDRSLARWDVSNLGDVRFDAAGRFLVGHSSSMSPDLPGEHAYVFDADDAPPPLRLANPDTSERLLGLAWSPDGSLVAAAHGYTGAVVWDARTGEVRQRFAGHTGMVLGVAFSPDGRRLASQAMDSTVRVWDVASGTQIARCGGLPMARAFISFSPDGSLVLAASPEAVHLLDAASGVEKGRIPTTDSPWADLALTPDGQIATLHRDGSVRLWPLDPAAWLRARLARGLTLAETEQYGVGTESERLERELSRVLAHPLVGDLAALSKRLFEKDRAEDAVKCADLALRLAPDSPQALVAEARADSQRGDLDEAFARLDAARSHGLDARRLVDDPTLARLRGDARWKALFAPK